MNAPDIPAGSAASKPFGGRATVFIAAVVGTLLAVSIALWAKYGGAVFYELILIGIAACF